MDCKHACHAMQRLMMVLRQLEIAYGYLIQNAPTEESRRLMELNLMTVRNTMERLNDMMNDMTEFMTPTGDVLEETPVFTNFVDAARYAFIKETQAIAQLNNLITMMDDCYHNALRSIIVNHQLNAMRILFILS
jgi:tetrahydromethanopterin S-methyltransferase subunit B